MLSIVDTNPLSGGGTGDLKLYARGVGIIADEALELVEIIHPPCQPDTTTHCLQNGRFRVTVEWATAPGTSGDGQAILPSADSGEFWFFNGNNTELLVKLLNGCGVNQRYWMFASGLTNVEVTLTVTDTRSGETKVYENPQGRNFRPVLDTTAFATCP